MLLARGYLPSSFGDRSLIYVSSLASTMSSNEPPYGHILSKKSAYLERDTFVFITPRRIEADLFLGVNQKITPVTSATIHRWAEFMNDDFDTEGFFLCPVTVESAGIMRYRVEPSGPAIEPYSTNPLPLGNYGWYFNREHENTLFIP